MSEVSSTWTPDRIAELRRLFEAGLTCSQIAREICVTRNAVIGKLSRLGLSRPDGGSENRRGPRPRGPARASQGRILKLLQADVEPMPFDADESTSGQRCSLLELSPQSCRWPIGSPGAPDFGFCGNDPVGGLPYCPGHARMAYQSAARRVVRA